jgi:hypothetical protein
VAEASINFGKMLEEEWRDFRKKVENSWNNKLDRTIMLLYALVAFCAFLMSLFGPGLDLDIRQRCGAAGAGSLFLAVIYFLTLAGDIEETHT